MKLKLEQMNLLIQNIVKAMDDDSLLLVMGDHGMTKSGDHGGDSIDELKAALFAYSHRMKTSTNQIKVIRFKLYLIELILMWNLG